MTAATWRDTLNIVAGSGALYYPWWHDFELTGDDTPGWQAKITADDGNGGETWTTVDHQSFMRVVREVAHRRLTKNVGQLTTRECENLAFNRADVADFDADRADQVLQLMVLGEIIFG